MRLRHGKVHVLHHGIDGRMFAQEQIFDFTPALQSDERVHVLKEEVLPLDRVCLRQHFQCLCRPANFIQPRSQGEERFIGQVRAALVSLCQARGVSETLHCIGNVLVRQGWILPGANFKCQQFVGRACIRMIFKSVRHFLQGHRPSGWSCWRSGELESRVTCIGGLSCRCWLLERRAGVNAAGYRGPSGRCHGDGAGGAVFAKASDARGLSSESDVLPPIAGMGGTACSFARRTSAPSDAGFFGSRATSSICFHASA